MASSSDTRRKKGKQMAEAKPYRVQKQTTERNLRRRKPPADAQRASHASPALTQITVAGSESVLGDRGASIWSMPGTPASPIVGPLDNCDDNERDEPEDDGVDEEIAPTGLAVSAADHDQDVFRRQQEPRTSPPAAIEHDAEGEPIHFEEPQEQSAPYEFIAMMAGDDAWMSMDMSMAGFRGHGGLWPMPASCKSPPGSPSPEGAHGELVCDQRRCVSRISSRSSWRKPADQQRGHNRRVSTAASSRTGLVAYGQSPRRDDQSITTSANRLRTIAKPARHRGPNAVPLHAGRGAGGHANKL
ncbi:hypothetical protein NCS55_01498800 [Fusarium keratoplasticum]|nr:hypothetical protein NCS55_01498800 [Fusarium keratoplasticum]